MTCEEVHQIADDRTLGMEKRERCTLEACLAFPKGPQFQEGKAFSNGLPTS